MREKSSRAPPGDIRINLRFGAGSEKWLVEELARRRPYTRAKYLRELIRLGSLAKRGKLPITGSASPTCEPTAKAAEGPTPTETGFDQSVLEEFGKLIR